MVLLARWRAERDLRARAAAYAAAIAAEPDEELARWLSRVATGGDLDHAAWELRYARRALGLLAAERDSLDDRTPSLVAAALSEAFRRDPAIAADRATLAERQFNQRLSAYRIAVREREPGRSTAERVARVLLRFAGEQNPDAPVEQRIARAAAEFLAGANEDLRRAFGEASLPEDVRPSSMLRRG